MMKQIWPSLWLPLLLFAGLWGDLVRQLSFHWSTNPQYAFGWSVPFLLLFLVWEAWLTRPAPVAPEETRPALALAAVSAFCLLPARLFFEATPDWRFPVWVSSAGVLGLTLCAVFLLGGRPWLRQSAFPFAFILVGVPWPVKLEQPLIRALTDAVAGLTVQGLNLIGTPAVRRGSLIEISSGVVGIEEACSGIRSFQASLMASLFLGQLFALTLRARLGLIALGAGVAFVCNVFRAGMLTFIADRQGMAKIAQWHDSAGYTILLICFAVLCWVAMRLRPRAAAPLGGGVPSPVSLPPAFTWSLAAWLLVAGAGTEVWYRSGQHEAAAWWKVAWPAAEPQYAEVPLSEVIRAMQSDEAKGARWRDEEGRQYTMYFFRWRPGPASSRMLARFHRPEICLPAIGTTLVREEAPEAFRMGEVRLSFRSYLFDQNGRPLHVFFCVWEDEKALTAEAAPMESWTPATRLEAVRQKRRKLGQQVLEVGISGPGTEEEARAAFRRAIVPLISADRLPETASR